VKERRSNMAERPTCHMPPPGRAGLHRWLQMDASLREEEMARIGGLRVESDPPRACSTARQHGPPFPTSSWWDDHAATTLSRRRQPLRWSGRALACLDASGRGHRLCRTVCSELLMDREALPTNQVIEPPSQACTVRYRSSPPASPDSSSLTAPPPA